MDFHSLQAAPRDRGSRKNLLFAGRRQAAGQPWPRPLRDCGTPCSAAQEGSRLVCPAFRKLNPASTAAAGGSNAAYLGRFGTGWPSCRKNNYLCFNLSIAAHSSHSGGRPCRCSGDGIAQSHPGRTAVARHKQKPPALLPGVSNFLQRRNTALRWQLAFRTCNADRPGPPSATRRCCPWSRSSALHAGSGRCTCRSPDRRHRTPRRRDAGRRWS